MIDRIEGLSSILDGENQADYPDKAVASLVDRLRALLDLACEASDMGYKMRQLEEQRKLDQKEIISLKRKVASLQRKVDKVGRTKGALA